MGKIGTAEMVIWIVVFLALAAKVVVIIAMALRHKKREEAHMQSLKGLGSKETKPEDMEIR